MKKSLFLLSAYLLSSTSVFATNETASHNFNLQYLVENTCSIEVENNHLEAESLVIDDPTTADLKFSCTMLNGLEVFLSSQNGGLQKAEETNRIHFTAELIAGGLETVKLDTEYSGTAAASGTFISEMNQANGQVTVKLKQPQGFTPVGRYVDTLKIELAAIPASI